MSKIDLPSPSYTKSLLAASPPTSDPTGVTTTITALSLKPHPEGGFFVETDRDPRLVPNPFLNESTSEDSREANGAANADDATKGNQDPNSQAYNYHLANKKSTDRFRHASTSIHYFLAPSSPLGRFHRNKARTVHTLHWGRGAYVVLHPPKRDNVDGADGVALDGHWKMVGRAGWDVETFVVGKDVVKDEKVQWIVEGGRYKATYLLAESEDSEKATEQGRGVSEGGLLISETVVPGFEFSDHDFLTAENFLKVIGKESVNELGWLLGTEEGRKLDL